jgi:hypothetical protein
MKIFNQNNSGRSISMSVVIIFAFIGFLSTYLWISSNIRHPEFNQTINVIQNKVDKNYYEINPDTLSVFENNIKTVEIDKGDILFNRNPFFLIWTTLVLIMITIASGAFPVFVWQIIQLKYTFKLKFRHVLYAILFALAVTLFLILFQMSTKGFYMPSKIIDDFEILFKHGNIIPTIVAVTFVLQFPIIILIFLIGISANNIDINNIHKQNIDKIVSGFSMLNQILLNSLQILAILVVFSVLTTSALQQSIKTTLIIKTFDIFPNEVSYVYGLFFSLFLAIIFIPTYIFLRNCQNNLKQNLLNDINSEKSVNTEWYKNLIANLSTGGTALDNLKMSLMVLAPLISSFLPEQLWFFG